MARVTPKQTGSYSGPVYRDGFRLITPRVDASIGGLLGPNSQSPLDAVLVGSSGSRIYEPEDPANANEPWRDPQVIQLGAGDGVEVIVGGAGADNSLVAFIPYALEPLVDGDGVVIAFIERQLGTLLFALGTTTLGASNPLVTAFSAISSGDRVADTVQFSGTPPLSSEVVSPANNNPWASAIIQAQQATYIRFAVLNATVTASWGLARRLQGDALSVS